MYIPPNPNVAYFNLLLDFLNSFSQSEELFIIVGDFNHPEICWSTLSGSSLLSNQFWFESNLFQLITCPTLVNRSKHTWFTSHYYEHLIGHLSASESTSFLTSDHFLISFYVEHTPSPTKRFKLLLVFDYTCWLRRSMWLPTWIYFSCCFLSDSIEQVWSFIKQVILRGMNLFILKLRSEASKMVQL